jgi:hypothetical protein
MNAKAEAISKLLSLWSLTIPLDGARGVRPFAGRLRLTLLSIALLSYAKLR